MAYTLSTRRSKPKPTPLVPLISIPCRKLGIVHRDVPLLLVGVRCSAYDRRRQFVPCFKLSSITHEHLFASLHLSQDVLSTAIDPACSSHSVDCYPVTDKVWPWDEYPNKWQRRDLETNPVFKDKDGLIGAVQAKCYS